MAEIKLEQLGAVDRFITPERIYVDSSGEKVVAGDHPDAASLFAAAGDEVSREDAVRLGLVKATAADKKAAKAAADDEGDGE